MKEYLRVKIEYCLGIIFKVGVFTKAANGIWETFTGALIILLGPQRLGKFLAFLARRELFEHPRDGLMTFAMHALQSHSTRKFVALYFLIHGIVNLFLAIQLYRERLWAYVATVIAMSAYIVYQIHRINLYHSRLLMLVTVYDALFIILTWHEYRYRKQAKLLKSLSRANVV